MEETDREIAAGRFKLDRLWKRTTTGLMDREQVIAVLRGHEAELRAAGVFGLCLSGYTARGDQRPDSDVNRLAAFDKARRINRWKKTR